MEWVEFQSACGARWDRPRSRKRERLPKRLRKPSGRALGPRLVAEPVRLTKCLLGGGLTGSLLHFPRPQRLAVRTISTHLGACQEDLKCEMAFDLAAQPLQRLAEKLFNFAASQTDHVRMLLLHARFVIMLVPAVMHQVQLIHQTALLQQLERAIHRDPVELGIPQLGQLEETLGIQVLAALVDKFEEQRALAR